MNYTDKLYFGWAVVVYRQDKVVGKCFFNNEPYTPKTFDAIKKYFGDYAVVEKRYYTEVQPYM